MTATSSFPALVSQVSELVGAKGLNLLINNAGYKSSELKDLATVTPEDMVEHFQINCVAPLFLTRALLPLLQAAAALQPGPAMAVTRAAVVQISSIAASIGEVSEAWAGMYAYRCSKAALNMASASLAAEVGGSGVLVVSLHPGWVRTDMGGVEAPLAAEESVAAMLDTLGRLGEEDMGAFRTQDNKTLPW